MKYLLIDLRKSDEVYSQHFEHSEQYVKNIDRSFELKINIYV